MTSSPFSGGLINLRVNSPTAIGSKSDSVNSGFYTLMEYMGKEGEADDLVVLFGHLEYASKKIAALVASPFNSSLSKNIVGTGTSSSDRDKPKPLDLVSVCLCSMSISSFPLFYYQHILFSWSMGFFFMCHFNAMV